jgi:hypothetical protein
MMNDEERSLDPRRLGDHRLAGIDRGDDPRKRPFVPDLETVHGAGVILDFPCSELGIKVTDKGGEFHGWKNFF